jgi:class 3 adenylate cyclase
MRSCWSVLGEAYGVSVGLRLVREFDVHYAIHDDVSIAYAVFGEGPRDVLLQQNLCPVDLLGELPQLASFLDALGGIARVIAYDPRGAGASDSIVDPTSATLELHSDDAIAVLDAADSERATFFSLSSSSASAVVVAATHPSRIRSMILAYPRMSYPEFGGMSAVQRRKLARKLTTTEYLKRANPRVAHDPVLQRWWGRARRLVSSPEQMARNLEFAGLVDLESTLTAIHVPTLILHRRESRMWDIEHSREFARRIDGARIVELEGSETELFLGNTGEVLAEVDAFLSADDLSTSVDRPLMTVLFTDIVSSTEHLAAGGDNAWRKLLDEHDARADRIVAEYRGRVVRSTGDGILAIFDGPARAIRCAAALLASAAQQGIELRAGLHAGEIELRPPDIAGIAVHTASRIADLAGSNEILVSKTLVDLTAGSNLAFEPRGEHELKGLPGSWNLYAVRA